MIRSQLARAGILMLAATVCCGQAAAQDWYERGRDLLRDFGLEDTAARLSEDKIADGLREALRKGADLAVSQLGRRDGFNLDPVAHIPLPRRVGEVRDALAKVGLDGSLTDLELRLNRAAEQAVPSAKALFVKAIGELTLDDARRILDGPDDAATRYFERVMGDDLVARIRPLIDTALADAGAVRAYDKLNRKVSRMPWLPDLKADLGEHVSERASEAVFHYLAVQEAAIRRDPAKRTTELLKSVFGARD